MFYYMNKTTVISIISEHNLHIIKIVHDIHICSPSWR